MITKKQNRGFILAIKAGEVMMKSGGEIYRVEEVITRICRACGIPHVEVFATPTGIFASIGSGGEDSDTKLISKLFIIELMIFKKYQMSTHCHEAL